MKLLVTGATAGFGQAIVHRFAKAGHQVIAVGRRHTRLEQLTQQYGNAIYPVVLDVCDRDAIEALPTQLPDTFADVDIVVNNAGLALGLEKAMDADLNEWDVVIDTNIKGLCAMTRAFLPGMIQRGRGHIINLGSTAATYPYPGGNVYGASKAFVHQFSLNLRADLLGTPIRVTCIEPGLCEGTEFSQVRFRGDAVKAQAVYKGTDAITPQDIAETVFWVATQPPHVNINVVEMMPVCQAFAALAVHRT